MKTDAPKRRFLNIGPGLKIALLISALLMAKWVIDQRQTGRQHSLPPIVEPHPTYPAGLEKLGPTPEVKFIIDRARLLGLDAVQIARLNKLESSWQKLYGPKIARANAKAEKANRYLQSSQGNKRTPVAQIQNEAGPIIELSRDISSARRAYWEKAVRNITPAQRRVLDKEREKAWASKSKN